MSNDYPKQFSVEGKVAAEGEVDTALTQGTEPKDTTDKKSNLEIKRSLGNRRQRRHLSALTRRNGHTKRGQQGNRLHLPEDYWTMRIFKEMKQSKRILPALAVFEKELAARLAARKATDSNIK